MNAADLQGMIPFKTKFITRNGSKAVFTGNDGDGRYPINITIVEHGTETTDSERRRSPLGSTVCLTVGGLVAHPESDQEQEHRGFDIVKIIRQWEPMPGDFVVVSGITATQQPEIDWRENTGDVRIDNYKIIEPSRDGFFKLSSDRFHGEWITHRRNMSLIERPRRGL